MNMLPKFGTFTNGTYVVVGCIIFNRVIGKIISSNYPYLNEVGKWINWPNGSTIKDKKSHFMRYMEYKKWYSDDEIDWHKL